jgi:hypothetical protein
MHWGIFQVVVCFVQGSFFRVHELSRPKISKRSPRNPEKALARAVLTTEGPQPSGKIPADHVPPAGAESFSGQNFPGRKSVRPDFFAAKVGTVNFFRLES